LLKGAALNAVQIAELL